MSRRHRSRGTVTVIVLMPLMLVVGLFASWQRSAAGSSRAHPPAIAYSQR